MLFSVEQAFVGRDEKRAPLKMPTWEASKYWNYPKQGPQARLLSLKFALFSIETLYG